MRILVTGATGFIGSQLTRALLEAGHRVRILRRETSSLLALQGLGVESVHGDLTQPETLRSALRGMQAVFHCAAYLGGADLTRHRQVTVQGTRALAEAALAEGVERFVHTSSCAALGVPEPGDRTLMTETHTWRGLAQLYPYGYAKYRAELEIQDAVAKGLDAVIVNPAMVFGREDVYRRSTSILTSLDRGRVPACTEGGINVVHIRDVVNGHLAAFEKGERGCRYLLCGENLSYPELFSLYSSISGHPAPAMVVPGGLLRAFAQPARLLGGLLNIPLPLDLIALAGRYFYYDSASSIAALGLASPLPARQALSEGWQWFRSQTLQEV